MKITSAFAILACVLLEIVMAMPRNDAFEIHALHARSAKQGHSQGDTTSAALDPRNTNYYYVYSDELEEGDAEAVSGEASGAALGERNDDGYYVYVDEVEAANVGSDAVTGAASDIVA